MATNYYLQNVHLVVFFLCVSMMFIVFGVMGYCFVKGRLAQQHGPFHRNVAVEMVWAIIPLLIIVLLAVPTAKWCIQHRMQSANIHHDTISRVIVVSSRSESA